jgi:hypothetical protein
MIVAYSEEAPERLPHLLLYCNYYLSGYSNAIALGPPFEYIHDRMVFRWRYSTTGGGRPRVPRRTARGRARREDPSYSKRGSPASLLPPPASTAHPADVPQERHEKRRRPPVRSE